MPAFDSKSESSAQTVLLAEDDPFLRELVSGRLQSHGHRVIEAGSGDYALPLLRAGGIDILVTDISMPGSLDGWALAEHARLLHPQIVVVYWSSRPADATRQVSRSLHIQKPYHPDAIITAIRQLMSRPDEGGEHEGGSGGGREPCA